MNIAYNADCLKAMREMEDNAFDLAVVDPPYGIGANKMTLGNGKTKIYRGEDDWDKTAPGTDYFSELMRVSKNQIIWGANHFTEQFHQNSTGWIFWDKGTGENDFSDGEFAYTSFQTHARKIFISWVGSNAKEKGEARIHPTQKPVALYRWLYKTYAKPGDKILDTHLGSGSSRIAAYDAGLDFVGYEIDETYFKLQEERFARHTAQMNLFID